jgi:amidohydrolase
VSVTSIHGGTAFNVIPPEVNLEGTLRSFDTRVRQRVIERFEQIARGVGEAMGCQVELNIKRITPPLVNHDGVTSRVAQTVERLLSESNLDTGYQTMTAEDMAYMQERVPGCFFFVGSNDAARHLDYGHHHPKFDFHEEALIRGSALMAAAAIDILQQG